MKSVPIDGQFAADDLETHRVLAARWNRLSVDASRKQAQSSKARCAGPPHWRVVPEVYQLQGEFPQNCPRGRAVAAHDLQRQTDQFILARFDVFQHAGLR